MLSALSVVEAPVRKEGAGGKNLFVSKSFESGMESWVGSRRAIQSFTNIIC